MCLGDIVFVEEGDEDESGLVVGELMDEVLEVEEFDVGGGVVEGGEVGFLGDVVEGGGEGFVEVLRFFVSYDDC